MVIITELSEDAGTLIQPSEVGERVAGAIQPVSRKTWHLNLIMLKIVINNEILSTFKYVI